MAEIRQSVFMYRKECYTVLFCMLLLSFALMFLVFIRFGLIYIHSTSGYGLVMHAVLLLARSE